MSHFYGIMAGSGKPKTCRGHKTEGLKAKVNGWNSGIKIEAVYDEKEDKDIFTVYQTSGSNGSGLMVELGKLEGRKFIPSSFTKLSN